MNRQNFLSIPDESRIEELLGKIQPLPSEEFHQKMKLADWQADGGKQAVRNSFRLRLIFALLAVATLAILSLTPPGRAWAQEVFQFFGRINSLTIEFPESLSLLDVNQTYDIPLVPVYISAVSPEMAALPGCGTPQKAQSYACQVALAESRLGFDLKELPVKPEEWKFDFLHFDPAGKNALIGYSLDFRYNSYGTLYLSQGEGSYSAFYKTSPWEVVPEDKVETVKVGGYDGEYVRGSFSVPSGKDKAVWSDLEPHQRLAWSDGARWYLIDLWPNPNLPNSMDREKLIGLAESLVNSPVEPTEALDLDYLYSISDAEAISGLDLKAPALLPMDTIFSHARYSPDNNEVRLFYGLNDELIIYQWTGNSMDLDTLPSDYDPNSSYETVKINGENAFYGFVDGPDTRHFLWWKENGMNYQMYYYEYLGGMIDKEEMIAMAESMQDINDFRTKDARPYEYVSIYAQALGIDVLEFEKPLDGWSYGNIWGDPMGRCIYMIYKSVTEPGFLSVHQCGTDDPYNHASDIPAHVIERVKIGDHSGIYVEGDFITKDNGNLTWNPDPSIKRLYWEENGLWVNLLVTGESAVHHDKEDLISYAESLR